MTEEIIGNIGIETEKRGPGRPKRESAPVGQATPLTAAKPGAKSRKRVSEMARQILPDTSRMDPSYVYRVVNEGQNGVGIKSLLDRGYEIVQSDASLVTEETGKATSLTSQVNLVVNSSSGEKGVLMRIHKDYHAEDQADKQRVVASTETLMNLVSQDLKGAYAPKDDKGNQIAIKVG